MVLALYPTDRGSPALLIGARRSRDSVLRGSLKWLGVVFLLLLAASEVGTIVDSLPGISQANLTYSYPAVPTGIFLTLAAYAFYRNARSLAPISRLPAVEPGAFCSTDTAKS